MADGSKLDLTVGDDATSDAPGGAVGRPWIGVMFECCQVYTRVYREPRARQYDSNCPSCGLKITIQVSSDGVSTRLVRARPR